MLVPEERINAIRTQCSKFLMGIASNTDGLIHTECGVKPIVEYSDEGAHITNISTVYYQYIAKIHNGITNETFTWEIRIPIVIEIDMDMVPKMGYIGIIQTIIDSRIQYIKRTNWLTFVRPDIRRGIVKSLFGTKNQHARVIPMQEFVIKQCSN